MSWNDTHIRIRRGTVKDADGNLYIQGQWVPKKMKIVSATDAEMRRVFGIKKEEKKAVKQHGISD